MKVYLFCTGKLKDKNLEEIEKSYLKRINSPKLEIIELKANAERKDLEAKEVLNKANDLGVQQLITLEEKGENFNSIDFSRWTQKKLENYTSIAFVIAGAEGHGDEVLNKKNDSLSLSLLTYPHKLARIIFIEQFYRAQTIRSGHPYHN